MGSESPADDSGQSKPPDASERVRTTNWNLDVTYDPATGAYHSRCDWSQVSPSMAAVEVIATLKDQPVTEVSSLGTVMDVDAVDAILRRSTFDETGARVQFVHDGVRVEVGADGSIVARPR